MDPKTHPVAAAFKAAAELYRDLDRVAGPGPHARPAEKAAPAKRSGVLARKAHKTGRF